MLSNYMKFSLMLLVYRHPQFARNSNGCEEDSGHRPGPSDECNA